MSVNKTGLLQFSGSSLWRVSQSERTISFQDTWKDLLHTNFPWRCRCSLSFQRYQADGLYEDVGTF